MERNSLMWVGFGILVAASVGALAVAVARRRGNDRDVAELGARAAKAAALTSEQASYCHLGCQSPIGPKWPSSCSCAFGD